MVSTFNQKWVDKLSVVDREFIGLPGVTRDRGNPLECKKVYQVERL